MMCSCGKAGSLVDHSYGLKEYGDDGTFVLARSGRADSHDDGKRLLLVPLVPISQGALDQAWLSKHMPAT